MSFRHNLPPLPSVPDTFEQLPSTQEKPAIAPSVSLSRPTTVVPVTHHASETPVHETEHVEVDTVPAQIAKVATAATAEVVDSGPNNVGAIAEGQLEKRIADQTNPPDESAGTERDKEQIEPQVADEESEGVAPPVGGSGGPPKPPVEPPETHSSSGSDEPGDRPEQSRPGGNLPGRYEGPIHVEFIVPRHEPSPDSPQQSSHASEPVGQPDESDLDQLPDQDRPEPRGVQRYQQELKDMTRGIEATLDHRTPQSIRVRTTGTMTEGRYHLSVVESPQSSAEETARDIEDALHRATDSVNDIEEDAEHAALASGEASPGQGNYRIDDRVAYDYRDNGVISRQVVRKLDDNGEPGEHLITLSTVMLPETEQGDELLQGWTYSDANGNVVNGQFTGIAAVDVADYYECSEVFGSERSVLHRVLEGAVKVDVTTVVAITNALEKITQETAYSEAEVVDSIRKASRIGSSIRAQHARDNGITPARLARLQRRIRSMP